MSTSSVPSHVSSSSERGTPVPVSASPVPGPFRVMSPGQSAVALSKYTDNDLRHKNPDELVAMIRQLESENRSIMAEHSSIIKDVNRRIQMYHLEIKGLKDINQKLQDDNQELRDLCCFLDDDRQRGRKLAREWQRFGRYTASVMRSEVSAYQEKLAALEKKQDELINDNMELKELCLYLDQERIRFMQTRDEGDGSSNSTTAGNEEYSHLPTTLDLEAMSPNVSDRNMTDESTGNVSQGETPAHQHVQEKARPTQNRSFELRGTPVGNNGEHNLSTTSSSHSVSANLSPPVPPSLNLTSTSIDSPSKPEAVVHAMKVLEVHEQLEKAKAENGGENLDDKEKAIVREMCNVVWRKLGDVGSERSTPQVTPHPTYENITYRGATSPPQNSTFSPPLQRHSSRSSPMHQRQQPQVQNQNRRRNSPQYKGQPQPPYHHNPASVKYSPSDSSHSQHSRPPPPPPPPHPGVSQTVHSNAVPNYQQYRSPPPSQPMESISASTTTTYINDPLLSPRNQLDNSKECNEPPRRPPPVTKPHSKSPTSHNYPAQPHQHRMYPQPRSVSESPLPRPQSARVTPTQSKHFSESDLQHPGSHQHYAHSVGDLRSYNQDPRDHRRHQAENPLHSNQRNSSEENILRNSSQQISRGSYRNPPDPRNSSDVIADRGVNRGNMSYH
ncbi:hypothetical protein FSP39_017318 [Pinctada imbricata]|uniref:Coiled-coil domain-containing protein 85C n=1 Tax=Pinctada imbricata TaxID=66713 RepID=A0AA88Y0J5_PINIB|nr:hypothetical protein FSP39_017318 [Pinctada imbricata]